MDSPHGFSPGCARHTFMMELRLPAEVNVHFSSIFLSLGCWCGVEEEEAPEQSIPVEVSHGHLAKQVHSFRWLTLVTYVAPS